MYIFFLFFQFTMIPETTKDPGSICTIASASRVFLICIIIAEKAGQIFRFGEALLLS